MLKAFAVMVNAFFVGGRIRNAAGILARAFSGEKSQPFKLKGNWFGFPFLFLNMRASSCEVGSLAPIGEEILFVFSVGFNPLEKQKDWNGKRGARFLMDLSFRF